MIMLGMKDDDTVFVLTGEPSGDLYAYFFLKKLLSKIDLHITGIGGEWLKAFGQSGIQDRGGLMTFGLASALTTLYENYRVYRKAAREIRRVMPQTFIAFAYPGVNLLLARYARKMRCAVWYALPPQIWAWGSFRKYFVKKWVDRVISFFPFEYRFYKKLRIRTELVENPLLKELQAFKRIDPAKRIGFMPGSRPSEIRRNLPVIVKIAEAVRHSESGFELALILHPDTRLLCLSSLITHNSDFKVYTANRYQAMRNCDMLVTCSGTASLEAAMMGIPQVFFNRPSFLDYHLFRYFLTTKEYNLANLFYEERIVPSFVGRNTQGLVNNVLQAICSHTRSEKIRPTE